MEQTQLGELPGTESVLCHFLPSSSGWVGVMRDRSQVPCMGSEKFRRHDS